MDLLHDEFSSPLGQVHIVSDGTHLIAVDFGDVDDRFMPLLEKRFGKGVKLANACDTGGFTSILQRYFDGELDVVNGLALNSGGTAFQQRVWGELMRIRAGETKSYGALAADLGDANASRAVGLANGKNPINIAVPCHRVIGANGSLTGYGGGIERKRWLLRHEGVLTGDQADLFG